MLHGSMIRRTLVVAGLGLIAILANPLAATILLAIGTAMAAKVLLNGAGAVRIVPAVVLIAIVAGAIYAPVKTIERVKARRLTLSKSSMTIAELRDPVGHDLPHFRFNLPCYFAKQEQDVGLDDRVVRFASPELTVEEFIRAIEEQTPLRHRFSSCGNAGSSILFGRNCAIGLSFREPDQ